MSKKRTPAERPLPRPKAGPGQEFRRELIDAKSGHARRFRNIATTPLHHAWFRGMLCNAPGSVSSVTAEDRLAAGEIFESLWYAAHGPPGRDSTQIIRVSGGEHAMAQSQQFALIRLSTLAMAMYSVNFEIVRQFCGDGHDLAMALRKAGIDVHEDGRAFRLREALDDLVCVVAGMRKAQKAA